MFNFCIQTALQSDDIGSLFDEGNPIQTPNLKRLAARDP